MVIFFTESSLRGGGFLTGTFSSGGGLLTENLISSPSFFAGDFEPSSSTNIRPLFSSM